jgi:ribosome-binding factor A
MSSDPKRENRLSVLYMKLAADFLARESTGGGLLTVTGLSISKDRKNTIILFTVFPDKFEEQAVNFAKRKRSEFREYVKSHTPNLGFYPMFDFEIDLGEKNRQKIDSLIQKTK